MNYVLKCIHIQFPRGGRDRPVLRAGPALVLQGPGLLDWLGASGAALLYTALHCLAAHCTVQVSAMDPYRPLERDVSILDASPAILMTTLLFCLPANPVW